MPLPKLTESLIRAGATPQSFQRGRDYYQQDAISDTARQGNLLSGECAGSSAPYYQVQVALDAAGIGEATCTCPYDFDGHCKHIVALLLTYLHHPKRFVARKPPADLLAGLEPDELAPLLTQLLTEKPELYNWVESAVAVPKSKSKNPPGKKRPPVDAAPYRRQIRGILHSLDGLRMSEAYWHVGGLAQELRGVQNTALKFLEAGDAGTALTILVTLLDEASQGIEFLDDSNGELGDFVSQLGQPLAEALLSLELSAAERSKLVAQLTGLVDNAGDYGMDGNLHIAIQAAKYGWAKVPGGSPPQARLRSTSFDPFEDLDDLDADDQEIYLARYQRVSPSPLNRLGDLIDAKLSVLDRQGRTDEFLTLAKRARRHLPYVLKLCELKRVPEALTYARKHLTHADEAHQVSLKLRELRQLPEALQFGEYGLTLKGPQVRLGQWLGPLAEAQGHSDLALRAWQAAFPENPSLDTYQTIQRLAGSKWKKLRPAVILQLRKSFNKQVLAEVLLFEQEWDEAIKVAAGPNIWYPILETVAAGVLAHRPQWVAAISLKQADRLMLETKSKNYPIAAQWLKRAKAAHKLLGQTAEWKAYLQKAKEKYNRRPSLMGYLNHL